MSSSRYPAYKDSGVEWLGEVPAHWSVTRVKYVASSIQIGPFGGMLLDLSAEDTGYKVLGQENTISGDLTRGRRWVSKQRYDELGAYQVRPGDLLLTRKGSVGNAHLVTHLPQPSIIDSDSIRVRVHEDVSTAELLAMLLHEAPYVAEQIEGTKRGAILAGLNSQTIANLYLLLPPLPEQNQVLNFLFSRFREIDALIAEQARLIELLKEKRQAVISHAVTKGLDPTVAMKDSGVEWLGKVPAHWNVQRIKHLTLSIEQGWSPQCEGYPAESASEWGVLKVGCVNGGTFNPSENKVLPPDLEPITSLSIEKDDLLVSRANTRELVGSAALADQSYPNLLLCDKLYRFRVNPATCCPAFLCRYLGSSEARGQIELDATGASASMVNIGQAVIMEMAIAVPPLREQREIVADLIREVSRLDALITEAQRAIDLLQERRTALITAAVTGQIDVRGLA
jgi:type I restriction enzyme S subunit